jgi:hypothetical protein
MAAWLTGHRNAVGEEVAGSKSVKNREAFSLKYFPNLLAFFVEMILRK